MAARAHLRRAVLRAALVGAAALAWRPTSAQGTKPMKLFVRVIGPRDGLADSSGPLEDWIVTEAKAKDVADPRAMSGWIELGAEPRTLHRSPMGGRVVTAVWADDGKGETALLRVTGTKIDPPRQDVAIPLHAGARQVVALTRYPGGRNMALAVEIR